VPTLWLRDSLSERFMTAANLFVANKDAVNICR
jgi:hypothetical protein